MATIELGIQPAAADADRADPPAGPRSPIDRRSAVRRAGLALGLVAALLSPAAQAPPPPGMVLVQTLPYGGGPPAIEAGIDHGTGPAVDRGTSYGLAPTASGMALTAYRLADGVARWSVPVTASQSMPEVALHGGLPVVTGLDPSRPGQFEAEMAVHDPDTGRLLWSRVGYPVPRDAMDGWLVVRRQLSHAASSPGQAATEFAAVDLRTGRTGWRFRVGEQVANAVDLRGTAPDGSPAGFAVTLRPDGVLARHDLVTGAELTRVRTDIPGAEAYLQLVGGLLFVTYRDGTWRPLAVFDAATLAPRWREDGGEAGYAECGPVLCLWQSGPPARLSGVDPVTGRTWWSTPCATADGRCDIAVEALGPDLIAVQEEPSNPAGRLLPARVLDAATGAPVSALHGWFPMWPSDRPDPVLQRVLRERGEGRAEGRFAFARLLADGAGVRQLGAVDAQWCQLRGDRGDHLVCSTDDAWTVWRLH